MVTVSVSEGTHTMLEGSRSDRLDRAIHALLSQTPEIEAAAVVSFDGLPMASALPPSMDEDRVAAMSAALPQSQRSSGRSWRSRGTSPAT